MITATEAMQPLAQEISGCFAEPPEKGTSRELLDDLINALVSKRERIEALRRTLPNDMTPDAVEAFCNLAGTPGSAATGLGVKQLLSQTRRRVENDINNLCAFRRALPEEFGSVEAELGLAVLVTQFSYN